MKIGSNWWVIVVTVSMVVSSSCVEAQLLRRNRGYNNQNCDNCNQNNSGSASYLAPGEILLSESVAQPVTSSATSYANESVVYANESPIEDVTPVSYAQPVSYEQPVSYAEPVSYAQPVSYEQPVSYAELVSYAEPVAYAQPAISNSTSGRYRPMPAYTNSIGTQPHDIGYQGPGDMRTHLWRDHRSDLTVAGLSYERVMSLSATEAQNWHNYFHGTEASPAGGFSQY